MTPFEPTDTRVLVLDLETTHLDERAPSAALLEFGAVLCDGTPDLNPIAEASVLMRPPGAQPDHDRLWASMDPFVRGMHERSGLWEAAVHSTEAWNLDQADRALQGWLRGHAGTREVVLAGSGVSHFDDRWLRDQLPLVWAAVTYWSLDAGVIRRALQFAGREDLVDLAGDVEAKPHRALADARLHAAELRRYLGLLGQLSVQAEQDAGEVTAPGA